MKRVGAWLIGARGSISCVTIAGHSAITLGLANQNGMVTSRPEFVDAKLLDLADLVFGGHDISVTPLRDVASHVFSRCLMPMPDERILGDLDDCDGRIRPGISKSDHQASSTSQAKTDIELTAIISDDLNLFRNENKLHHVIVVNLASTEPVSPDSSTYATIESLKAAMTVGTSHLPASAIYAYAAITSGCSYINFTPSRGSDIPALWELAVQNRVVHMGCDGKTGETLVKSVLAEMFRQRNLTVLSWFGQNILGGGDGRSLSDPANKASKLITKENVLSKVLGYAPEHHVGIDYVASLDEWKIAWDHIHFSGFLGGAMSMEFTWRGMDSMLAAPLVLDLIRLTALALDRGEYGALSALACFFKRPMGSNEARFSAQNEALLSWVYGAGDL